MKIGFIGLGKMGYQIVKKLSEAGHEMIVLDVDKEAVEKAIKSGAKSANDRNELVKMLGENPVVWLMIPSNFTSNEIDQFANILPRGALLIDGGNTNFNETIENAKKLSSKGIEMMDVGTSGGVMGLENGFSLMIGGSRENYNRMTPAFDVLASPRGAHQYMGESGRGHFVKMVHNGIEYGIMQALAEGYQLLKEGPMKDLDLEKIAEVWQHGSIIESTLNKLMVEIYNENPDFEGVDGYVADSGEGRWTLDSAHQNNIKMPVLEDALKVRFDSQNGEVSYATKILAALRNKFGGHNINKK